MHILKPSLLFLLLLSGFPFQAVTLAQSSIEATAEKEQFDPISAMLDSLVTLTHVVRYNQLEANCYDPNAAVPSTAPIFSDQEYTNRISNIHSPIPLSYNKYVKEYIDLYAVRKRGLTQRVMGLSNLYFPLFEEILDREGLPIEFKYLSVVESALNPIAVSRVGATGIWQFMYNTGLMYDLKVNSYIDDRRDPVKATMAACQYFKDMYRIYNDWLLVIAAYNCGPGNVNRAITRSGGKTNFWEIMPYLPAETRGYVPAFIAVTYVMNYSREHNLYPVAPAFSYFEVDTLTVDRPVSFQVLSRELDIPADVIAYLNPIYKRGHIPDVGENWVLRLPTSKMSRFLTGQEQIFEASRPAARPVYAVRVNDDREDDKVSGDETTTLKRVKKTHTVRRGENLASIASKYNMTSADVKKLNRMRTTRIHPGQKLQVYSLVKTKAPVVKSGELAQAGQKASDGRDSGTGGSDVLAVQDKAAAGTDSVLTGADSLKKDVAARTIIPVSQNPRFIYHVVQPGDTLWNIAKRYEGVTVEMIKNINNLRNANITPGTKLKVIVAG